MEELITNDNRIDKTKIKTKFTGLRDVQRFLTDEDVEKSVAEAYEIKELCYYDYSDKIEE